MEPSASQATPIARTIRLHHPCIHTAPSTPTLGRRMWPSREAIQSSNTRYRLRHEERRNRPTSNSAALQKLRRHARMHGLEVQQRQEIDRSKLTVDRRRRANLGTDRHV